MAGVTPHPQEAWMRQSARNVTMEAWGGLKPGQSLIHDRDTQCCAACKQIMDDAGVTRVPLLPRAPQLHGFAERCVRSVQEEAFSRMILCGERALWQVLNNYMAPYHEERPHPGKGNVMLFPSAHAGQAPDEPRYCRERLGGLRQYYHRKAA
jgi:putative transposase